MTTWWRNPLARPRFRQRRWLSPTFVSPLAHLRPDADDLDGTWTQESGGTNLFASIDEASFSDADYIKSRQTPVADICRVRLSDPTTGKVFSAPVTVSYRYSNIGNGSVDITVTLKQGSTQIAQWVHSSVSSSSYVTAAQVLTSPQIAAITDWTNLFLEFQAG
jgi:hypothetical protein